jgi:hypothetical protein
VSRRGVPPPESIETQSFDERGRVPSVRPVRAADIEFRFHAMPARLLNEHAGEREDRVDLDVKYPRATPAPPRSCDAVLVTSARCLSGGRIPFRGRGAPCERRSRISELNMDASARLGYR